MKGKCNDERTAECRMIPVFRKGGLVGGKKPGTYGMKLWKEQAQCTGTSGSFRAVRKAVHAGKIKNTGYL